MAAKKNFRPFFQGNRRFSSKIADAHVRVGEENFLASDDHLTSFAGRRPPPFLLAPEAALAISLAIRLREVLIDVPGLLLWQHAVGRALFRRRKEAENSQPIE